jgi:hypothetical protein
VLRLCVLVTGRVSVVSITHAFEECPNACGCFPPRTEMSWQAVLTVLTALTVVAWLSTLELILIVRVPARPSQLKAISMPPCAGTSVHGARVWVGMPSRLCKIYRNRQRCRTRPPQNRARAFVERMSVLGMAGVPAWARRSHMCPPQTFIAEDAPLDVADDAPEIGLKLA